MAEPVDIRKASKQQLIAAIRSIATDAVRSQGSYASVLALEGLLDPEAPNQVCGWEGCEEIPDHRGVLATVLEVARTVLDVTALFRRRKK